MTPEILHECEQDLLKIHRGLLLQLANMKGILTTCYECSEPLTDDEIRGAIDAKLRYPICDDCFSDWKV